VHVLTKIFIVLVALLAVMLVPLVVVYAKNENNYKSRYERAEQLRAAAEAAADRAMISQNTEVGRRENTINSLRDEIAGLLRQVTEKNAQMARLESDLATSRQTLAQISGSISSIDSRLDAGQSLIEALVTEAGDMRERALAAERVNSQLETELREQGRNLEVAESAMRQLQVEVQRLGEANARQLETIGRYVQAHGPLGDGVLAGVVGAPRIDRYVNTRVIDVRTENGVVYAEIEAGQRDGIKEGWELTLGDGEGGYLGRLRVVRVDLNRATGVAQDANGRPVTIPVGSVAVAFPN
jgi:uncharacterized coiled-coil protein SlyX